MKKLSFLFAVLGIMVSAGLTQSCSSDNDGNGVDYSNALVTVKPLTDNTFYMQLDDNTTLFPVNAKNLPFGKKEVRALTRYTKVDNYVGPYTHGVNVIWLDSILTKSLVPNLGDEENLKKYGSDPVEIVNDWVTIAEDGYLTLRFRTLWGGQKVHYINMVYRSDANNQYTVYLYHNANGDTSGIMGDGLVAFKLDGLPDTKGQTVDLTLKWVSFSGEKTTTFKYCTRKATNLWTSDEIERINNKNIN